jgi:hypothetical protein
MERGGEGPDGSAELLSSFPGNSPAGGTNEFREAQAALNGGPRLDGSANFAGGLEPILNRAGPTPGAS